MSISEIKRQSIASFSSKIVYTFLGFLSIIYFARTVGPTILGTYFLFIAYFGIIDMLSDGGFGRAAVKRISEGEEQNEYYSAFFVLKTAVTVLIIISLILIKNSISSSVSVNTLDWLILAQFVALFHCLVAKGVAGRGKMGIYAIGELINNTSRIILQAIAVFMGYYLAGLMGGFILGLAIATIIQLKFFDLHFTRFKWRHIKNLTTFSFWLFLTSTGVVLYSHADVIMIGYFIDDSSVGYYKVAFQLAAFTTLVTASLSMTLWPKISRWGKNGSKKSIEKALSSALTFSFFLALPIFAGGILLGDKILYFFYGEEFALGYYTLVILLCAQLVNIFQILFTMCLSALDRQKDSFKVTAIGSTSNIILNILMIPLLGIEGAALATFVTLGLNAVLARNVLSRAIDVKIGRKSFVNILKATITMSIFILLYKYFIVINTIWFILLPILLGALIYTKHVLKQDLEINGEFKDVFEKMNMTFNKHK